MGFSRIPFVILGEITLDRPRWSTKFFRNSKSVFIGEHFVCCSDYFFFCTNVRHSIEMDCWGAIGRDGQHGSCHVLLRYRVGPRGGHRLVSQPRTLDGNILVHYCKRLFENNIKYWLLCGSVCQCMKHSTLIAHLTFCGGFFRFAGKFTDFRQGPVTDCIARDYFARQ